MEIAHSGRKMESKEIWSHARDAATAAATLCKTMASATAAQNRQNGLSRLSGCLHIDCHRERADTYTLRELQPTG